MDANVREAIDIDNNLEKLLKDIIKEERIQNYTIEQNDHSGSKKGEGYMGAITTVQISGEDKEGNSKTVNLIVKRATDDLKRKLPVEFIFEREIFMYRSVFPEFASLERKLGVASFHFSPKLYTATMEKGNEALIMENLRASGFSLYERRKPMNEEHVGLVMAAYGRFHALSFALRSQKPENFEKTVGSLHDLYLLFIKVGFKNALIKRCYETRKVLDLDTDLEISKHYDKFVSSMESFFDELENGIDEYSVAIHGDPWTNNMMFKYEDENFKTKPTQVRLIDFQNSRLASPVLDLSHFIYACSSKQILDNLDHFLRLYYTSLSACLKELGSDPEKLFPFEVLQQHWKKYARYGLIMSIISIYIMLTEESEVVDLSDYFTSEENMTEVFMYGIANITEYNKRVRDVILHFVANRFI